MKKILIQITVYCGCLIGSGFATGKEIEVYFINENKINMFSVILVSILFSLLFFVDSFNRHYDYVSTIEVNHKKRLNFFFPAIKLIYLLCMISVFLAGISTLMSHYLKLSYVISVAIVMFIFMFLAMQNLKTAVNLNLIISAIIIVAITLISIGFIKQRNIDFLALTTDKFNASQLINGLIYVSYNIILPLSFSNAVSFGPKNEKKNLFKNFIFNILPACTIICILLTLVATCVSANKTISDMPFILIASKFGSQISCVYSFILLATMFVSAITTYHSLIAEINNLLVGDNIIKKTSKMFLVLLCSLLSCVGFANFIEKIYPILAVMGAIIILHSIKRFFSILLIVKSKKCII